MGESELVEMISRNHGIDIDLVRQQRGIDAREAAKRYLSPEIIRAIEEKERLIQDKDFSHLSLINAKITRMALLAFRPEDYQQEFYKTPEGKLWYDCNVMNSKDFEEIARVAYTDAQEYARSIRKGQARTLATLGRRPVRFKG